jgi:uracil-DNA glycosylase
MKPDYEKKFMFKVLECKECRKDDRTRGSIAKQAYPVYSFGNPYDEDGKKKEVVIVGLNPSEDEYGRSLPPKKSLESQLGYFQGDRQPHPYFKKLNRCFSRKAKRLLQCKKYVWEKALFLDLVKCGTSPEWSRLEPIPREVMIGNCEDYLMQQIKLYQPTLFISCGQDTRHWIERNQRQSNVQITSLKTRFQNAEKLREQRRRLEREIVKWKRETN